MSAHQKAEFSKSGLLAALVAIVILAVWGVAIFAVGYPAVVVPAVALSFLSIFVLVFMTRG
ncbi:MAG: hypothetical protein N4A65_09895 [Cohaesibacter sp.]|jgi:hypothetical protein|nr:hypothetical protein [Cohaesibacter sp.]